MPILSRPVSPAAAAALAGSAAVLAAAAFILRALRATPPSEGAVVVVTGGSRGLGLAIASRFAQRRGSQKSGSQTRLVLAARDRAELELAQSTLLARHTHLRPEDFHLVSADLADPAECRRLIRETIARFGRLDVLVNNAGIIEVGPLESQSLEAFERALQINFLAALYTTWAALPHMRAQPPLSNSAGGTKRRAAIVNIASIGGKVAVPHMLPYTVAKFALVGLSQGLHAELRGKGIRVTTVCPGLMRTGGEAHAHFAGNVEAEKRWFNLGAKTPILSASVAHAASRIYRAVASGRAEITITPQAWLAARLAGLAPETTQLVASLVNEHILPAAPGPAPSSNEV